MVRRAYKAGERGRGHDPVCCGVGGGGWPRGGGWDSRRPPSARYKVVKATARCTVRPPLEGRDHALPFSFNNPWADSHGRMVTEAAQTKNQRRLGRGIRLCMICARAQGTVRGCGLPRTSQSGYWGPRAAQRSTRRPPALPRAHQVRTAESPHTTRWAHPWDPYTSTGCDPPQWSPPLGSKGALPQR
jgi:hypothetical protein